MRVHFSSIVAVFAALLLISGTTGCQLNGPWYQPSSYAFSSPFGKPGGQRSPDALAGSRPNLGERPNVDPPKGGYTNQGSLAQRSSQGTQGGFGTDPWGQQQTASQTPPEHLGLGNYSQVAVADPSNPPNYMVYGGENSSYASPQGAATPYQNTQYQQQYAPQQQYQYQQEMPQQQNQYYGASTYGQGQQSQMPYQVDNYMQTEYQTTSMHVQQNPVNQVAGGSPGGYAPWGTTPQNDPYAAMQQPTPAPPSNYDYGTAAAQGQGTYPGYPVGSGAPAGSPQQPPLQTQPNYLF